MVRWRNRIVGSGTEAPDQLCANPKNWRIHPKMQQDALAGVLDQVGWVQNIIVNQRTGYVIDGHARVGLALRRAETQVPVLYVDLSDSEEDLILATLDPLAALAGTDHTKLGELLSDLRSDSKDVQDLIGRLARDVQVPDAASRLGQLAYRVIVACSGESQQREVIERMQGEGFECTALIS